MIDTKEKVLVVQVNSEGKEDFTIYYYKDDMDTYIIENATGSIDIPKAAVVKMFKLLIPLVL